MLKILLRRLGQVGQRPEQANCFLRMGLLRNIEVLQIRLTVVRVPSALKLFSILPLSSLLALAHLWDSPCMRRGLERLLRLWRPIVRRLPPVSDKVSEW